MSEQPSILFILPTMPDRTPYIEYYKEIFIRLGCKCFYLYCNREGKELDKNSSAFEDAIIYDKKINNDGNALYKILKYYQWSRWVKKQLKGREFDLVVVHTIAPAVFLQSYLRKHYKNRYVFDIRDYSIFAKLPLLRSKVTKLLQYSYVNAISSEGFLEWLPKNMKYVISHNVGKRILTAPGCELPQFTKSSKIRILTIGTIRDFDTNLSFIKAFQGSDEFELQFWGDSSIASELSKLSAENGYANVFFNGRYNKIQENEIVAQSDLLNLLMDDNMVSRYLMSNRFYLGVTQYRPMIVNKNTYQAEFVEKYNLGIVLDKDDDIVEKINKYIQKFNPILFIDGCSKMKEIIAQDFASFESTICSAIGQIHARGEANDIITPPI